MAGRPKKPTAHLELVGAFKKDPQRKRAAEPQCDEPPIMPRGILTKPGRRAWRFLVKTAVPGVLTQMDSAYLAVTANALGAVWDDPAATITDLKQVGIMLGKLGMTPSDRSNVVVPKKKDNAFAQFKKA